MTVSAWTCCTPDSQVNFVVHTWYGWSPAKKSVHVNLMYVLFTTKLWCTLLVRILARGRYSRRQSHVLLIHEWTWMYTLETDSRLRTTVSMSIWSTCDIQVTLDVCASSKFAQCTTFSASIRCTPDSRVNCLTTVGTDNRPQAMIFKSNWFTPGSPENCTTHYWNRFQPT